jgi:hypothetical protein
LRAVKLISRRQPRFHEGKCRGEAGKVRLLRKVAHRDALAGDPLAAIRLDLAGKDLEERRLAGAVASDQREPVPLADIHLDVFEQRLAPEALRDVLKAEKRRGRGHGAERAIPSNVCRHART